MKQNQKYFFLGKYPLGGICLIFMFAISCSKEKNDIETAPDIALNKSSLILEKGQTERLIASFTPSDTPNKGHIWESSDAGIATVDETGVVCAVGIGESVITVTALAGKKKAKC